MRTGTVVLQYANEIHNAKKYLLFQVTYKTKFHTKFLVCEYHIGLTA